MARDGSQFLNAHVFPGGQVDSSDHGDLRTAALRELYEEANIDLLPNLSNISSPRVIPREVEDSSKIPYLRYIENRKETAEDSLIHFSRWVTPKIMRRRFDTHFFMAICSMDDVPVDGKVDGQEIKSLTWLTPTQVLAQFQERKIILFPPQWYF